MLVARGPEADAADETGLRQALLDGGYDVIVLPGRTGLVEGGPTMMDPPGTPAESAMCPGDAGTIAVIGLDGAAGTTLTLAAEDDRIARTYAILRSPDAPLGRPDEADAMARLIRGAADGRGRGALLLISRAHWKALTPATRRAYLEAARAASLGLREGSFAAWLIEADTADAWRENVAALILCDLARSAAEGPEPVEAPFPWRGPERPVIPDRVFDIRRYGAVGDGSTLNTRAIASAVEACAAAGGGRVIIPAGVWLTGPIRLQSRVELHLAPGAELRFATDPALYLPPVRTRFEGVECFNISPLVYAADCSDVAITGTGTLNGQGESWWPWRGRQREAVRALNRAEAEGTPVEERLFGTVRQALRPSFIQFMNCRRVLVDGVSVENGPMWTIHPIYSEDVVIRNVFVRTEGPNTDGVVVDSCHGVLVENCGFATGDDCIVVKAGRGDDGRRVGRPSESIVIRRCHMARGHGGIAIGSETAGGVRNVFAYGCSMDGVARGIWLKADPYNGGLIERVWVRDIAMGRIAGEAVRISALYGTMPRNDAAPVAPVVRDIRLSGITCRRALHAVRICGPPNGPIERVSIENAAIASRDGLRCLRGRDVNLDHVRIAVERGPVMVFADSRDVTISRCSGTSAGEAFLELEGAATENVTLRDNDVSGVERAIRLRAQARSKAVVRE